MNTLSRTVPASKSNNKRVGCCLATGCLGLFVLALVAGAALIGWFLASPVVEDMRHRRDFDEQLWRDTDPATDDTMWPVRLCMVDDLIASEWLDGLNREGVVAMLGEPADKSFPGGAVDCDIHYYLGPERGLFRIDSEWLFITFGEDGTVDRAWIYTD